MTIKIQAYLTAALILFCTVVLNADVVVSSNAMNNYLIGQNIKKAKNIYNSAVKSYESGNYEEAKRLYSNAIRELANADINSAINFNSKKEIESLFDKYSKLLNIDYSKDTDAIKHYTISIDKNNEVVQKFINQFTKTSYGREEITKALERSGKYREMITGILKEYDLPQELAYLPVVESLYKNNALSRCGALGLWQLMPATARNLGLKVNYWVDERKNPEKATRAAAKYLKDLYLWFNDWHVALAAYNRGGNGIECDLKFAKATNFKALGKHKAIPSETEYFVPKFEACTIIGENFRDYGLEVSFEKPSEYDEAVINNVIDLNIIETCIGMENVIRDLNPEISAWCTPTNYPDYALKLPAGTKELFKNNIALVKDLNPSRGFVRYSVKAGDCLTKIANKFNTSVSALKKDNNLKSNILQPKQILVIMPGKKYFRQSQI